MHYDERLLAKVDALLLEDSKDLLQRDKEALLSSLLAMLDDMHRNRCSPYHAIFRHTNLSPLTTTRLAEFPYLAVRLFKLLSLKSIPNSDVFKVLRSSGTTGQKPAEIFLDRETSARQSKALVKVMQPYIGKKRLPMLVIDAPSTVKGGHFSARSAGIQGMAFFGRSQTYALNDDMSLNMQAITSFCEKNANEPVLLFGFTYMVWVYFVQALIKTNTQISLPQGILVHSGGWKKLVDKQVTNSVFKETLQQRIKLKAIHNFYGMAEQVGSVFVECEHGHLHAPVMADVIIRSPYTLKPLAIGEEGLIQVLSALPLSYPGHSILTEDMGRILGVDSCDCGRKGKYFEVTQRLPKTELRGCSDTVSET